MQGGAELPPPAVAHTQRRDSVFRVRTSDQRAHGFKSQGTCCFSNALEFDLRCEIFKGIPTAKKHTGQDTGHLLNWSVTKCPPETAIRRRVETLTQTPQLDLVVVQALLAVALVAPRRVQAEAIFADLLAEQSTLVRVCEGRERPANQDCPATDRY